MEKDTPSAAVGTTRASSTATPDVAGNAGYAMFANAFYLASRLLLPPLVLSHLSLAEYGLWSACFILIMYIGLTDVGFSNVYVRFVARYHAHGDTAAINRLLSTGVITLSLLAVCVLSALWLALPQVLAFLKVLPEQRGMASILVMGSAAMFLLDLSLGAYCYLLHGLQRIREEKQVAIVGYAIEPVLILIFLLAGAGVYSLLAAFVLRYTWSLASFARLAHRFLPGLELRPRHFDKAMLRHFFGFGVAVQASTLLGTALFSIDRVIAGVLLGPKGIALFELGAKLPVAAISVPSSISNVAMPAAARHAANDDMPAIRALYRQSTRAVSLLAGLPLGFMAVFSAPLALAWLGTREGLEQMPQILALTALWSHLHIVTGPGTAVFRAMGRMGNEFLYHGMRIVALAAGIGLAMLFLGSTATALIVGLSGGSAVAAIAYLLYNQRQLALPVGELFREILLPGFVAYPLAAALLLLWQAVMPGLPGRWATLAGLLLFGLTYSTVWAAVTWKLLQEDERSRVRGLLDRFFNSFPKWKST
jgi:O-antigen/teichoic acid export membrane protein